MALPFHQNDLCCLPNCGSFCLGLRTFHRANLSLSARILVFERLQKTFHTMTKYTFKEKLIIAQI